MAEDTQPTNGVNTPAETPAPATGPDPSTLQDQLRAVTKQRSALSSRVQELEGVAAEAEKLRQQLAESQNLYSQDLHLLESHGITSARARKAIRREYTDEIGSSDKPPAFNEFVSGLKEDSFYGRLFAPAASETAQAPAPPVTAQSQPKAPPANPNAGVHQDRDPSRPLELNTFKTIKSRSERLELARRHGLIK